MAKLTDILKNSLDKKKSNNNSSIVGDHVQPEVQKKAAGKSVAPPKPIKKASARGK